MPNTKTYSLTMKQTTKLKYGTKETKEKTCHSIPWFERLQKMVLKTQFSYLKTWYTNYILLKGTILNEIY